MTAPPRGHRGPETRQGAALQANQRWIRRVLDKNRDDFVDQPGGGIESYTPVLTASTTNPTLGTGSSAVGTYYRYGPLITVFYKITFGSSGTNAGSGTYRISLPVASHSSLGDVGVGQSILVGTGVDMGVVYVNAANLLQVSIRTDDNVVSNTHPWAWGANHILEGSVTYRVA